MEKRKFGELELAILNLFKAGKKLSVKEVLTLVGKENKYNTIMTVMNRLYQKKLLFREKNGNHFEYWLAPNKENSIFDRLKKKVLGLSALEIASYLIESEEITEEDLLKMEKLIRSKREKHE